jgi:hypothetical protein
MGWDRPASAAVRVEEKISRPTRLSGWAKVKRGESAGEGLPWLGQLRAELASGVESNANQERIKMEPGGIEPPSRDSQHVASTRVSDDLISTAWTAISSIPRRPAPGVFSLRRPFAPRLSQPNVFWSAPYRASAANHAA